MEPKIPLHVLPQTQTDNRGTLSIVEFGKQLPFVIKRFYTITDVPEGAERGGHAHKQQEQAIFCLHGSFELINNDGGVEKTELVRAPHGVLLKSNVWHTMKNFSKDCIALVVASDLYDESDYIRDYGDFLTYVSNSIS